MEGSARHAGSAMTAMVVRQFAPSRIECDLLAQVFELICRKQSKQEMAGIVSLAMELPALIETERERTLDHSAGRRVA
jgi:hypothetical protein